MGEEILETTDMPTGESLLPIEDVVPMDAGIPMDVSAEETNEIPNQAALPITNEPVEENIGSSVSSEESDSFSEEAPEPKKSSSCCSSLFSRCGKSKSG